MVKGHPYQTTHIKVYLIVFIMLAVLLSACGGGSGNQASTNDNTPPAAPATGAIKIIRGGKVSVSGTAEPLAVINALFSDESESRTITNATGHYSVTSPNTMNGGSVILTATDASGNTSLKTSAIIPPPALKKGVLSMQVPLGKALIGVPYTTTVYPGSGTTRSDGSFDFKEGETAIIFTLAARKYSIQPQQKIRIKDFYPASDAINISHLKSILVNLDKDFDKTNGIDLSDISLLDKGLLKSIDPASSQQQIDKTLYQLTGKQPRLLFTPSVGINTEAPQAEADGAGQAMPFVDIFRTARPFSELSGNVTLDEDGWPTQVDPVKGYAKTKILQGTLKGAIPDGTYTLYYEGSGTLELGGPISNVKDIKDTKGITFDLKLESDVSANEINLNIKDIGMGDGNYIKNIRIVMPGGTCKNINDQYNPFIRIESQSDCPKNTRFVAFAKRLKNSDRSAPGNTVFNPDYLNFLRQFKMIRMMNLMESSHGSSACAKVINGVSEIDMACILKPVLWKDRAKMSDAVWGGSGRTEHSKRNGVPVEVVVALANTLHRDIWINIPHSADDNYVSQFASYVQQNLDISLKTYIEYSNETWNPGFISHFYVEKKGIEAGLNSVPAEFESYRDAEYFARLRFYTRRALQIFSLWKDAYSGSTDRLVRVIGTNQGDKVLTEQMLKYENAASRVDAVAMAPYFFGCTVNSGSCKNAPKVLKNAITVDDVFDIIDQDRTVDPSALSATIGKIEAQATIASRYNVQLLAYEGGQHLTTSVMGSLDLNETEKTRYRDLFKQVNRDPRMKLRYKTLLNAWHDNQESGTTLFTLYTLPQSYYRFGNWGLKEHLNKRRAESPKYDGVMSFQEAMGDCWWDGC